MGFTILQLRRLDLESTPSLNYQLKSLAIIPL
jgi:hypothetical protein